MAVTVAPCRLLFSPCTTPEISEVVSCENSLRKGIDNRTESSNKFLNLMCRIFAAKVWAGAIQKSTVRYFFINKGVTSGSEPRRHGGTLLLRRIIKL